MHRRMILKVTLSIILLLCLRVSAFPQWDDIDRKLENWVKHAEDLGFVVIETETSRIISILTLTYTLQPGTYHVFAGGGKRITDLGMFIYNSDGEEIAVFPKREDPELSVIEKNRLGLRSTPQQKLYTSAIIDFTLDETDVIDFELEVFRYKYEYDQGKLVEEDGLDRGFICFVLAEGEGGAATEGITRVVSSGTSSNILLRRRRYLNYGEKYWEEWFTRERSYLDAWKAYREKMATGEGTGLSSVSGARGWSPSEGFSGWDDWGRDDTATDRQRWDYTFSRLDGIYQEAYDNMLIPIMEHIIEIPSYDELYITLPQGRYAIYAAGGPYIEKLSFYIEDEWRFIYIENEVADSKNPVWFDVPFTVEVEIEVEADNAGGFLETDYYCMLLCMEKSY